MTPEQILIDWPPVLTNTQLEDLTLQAISYALANGVLYLPPGQPQPAIPTSAVHAPFSLFPTLFPRRLYELAQRLQRTYNVLYARIAQDTEFLDRVMGAEEGVGKVDDFIGQLWKGWKQLRNEGLAQPLQLGLFRSDYLLHVLPGESPKLKQVEFNTISVSFGALSDPVAALHRFLYAKTKYYNTSPHLRPDNFPSNGSLSGLVEGLASAHQAYNNDAAHILFVVQPGERNVFDQRPIEYQLLKNHSIHVIRRTFEELAHCSTIDPDTFALQVTCSPDIHSSGFVEISTVYFRSGYVPAEYPTPVHYATRIRLEKSRAIKCPSIALQLAGGKKVQEALTQPGVLERFLCDEAKWGRDIFSKEAVQEVRDTFMEMWGLDAGEDLLTPDLHAIASGTESFGVKRARELAPSLVLKPQREGGGNNIYKESINPFLDTLPPLERQAWIAMKLIVPPEGAGNFLVRAGGDGTAVRADVVSEVGTFGWALFGDSARPIEEKGVGWLVRTKGKESDEGGVATGFSVLDSLLLVDI